MHAAAGVLQRSVMDFMMQLTVVETQFVSVERVAEYSRLEGEPSDGDVAPPPGWPFAGEIRMGEVAVEMDVPELGFAVALGTIKVTECQMVNQFAGSAKVPPQFTRGYGLVFGQSERKAMSMALVDRSLRAGELGEDRVAPAQDEEFVISHSDNVQATGFVEHLKLPHYVDFQAELDLVRRMRGEFEDRAKDLDTATQEAAE